MKALLIAILVCMGFEAKALCEKTVLGNYYFEYKDAQKDEFTFYFETMDSCTAKEKWLTSSKGPVRLCSCEPSVRLKNLVYAPLMLGAMNKFLLYCYETDEKGLMSKKFIKSWSGERSKGDLTTSSQANKEACEKARFNTEEGYYKDKIKSHVEAHRPQQQEASR